MFIPKNCNHWQEINLKTVKRLYFDSISIFPTVKIKFKFNFQHMTTLSTRRLNINSDFFLDNTRTCASKVISLHDALEKQKLFNETFWTV